MAGFYRDDDEAAQEGTAGSNGTTTAADDAAQYARENPAPQEPTRSGSMRTPKDEHGNDVDVPLQQTHDPAPPSTDAVAGGSPGEDTEGNSIADQQDENNDNRRRKQKLEEYEQQAKLSTPLQGRTAKATASGNESNPLGIDAMGNKLQTTKAVVEAGKNPAAVEETNKRAAGDDYDGKESYDKIEAWIRKNHEDAKNARQARRDEEKKRAKWNIAANAIKNLADITGFAIAKGKGMAMGPDVVANDNSWADNHRKAMDRLDAQDDDADAKLTDSLVRIELGRQAAQKEAKKERELRAYREKMLALKQPSAAKGRELTDEEKRLLEARIKEREAQARKHDRWRPTQPRGGSSRQEKPPQTYAYIDADGKTHRLTAQEIDAMHDAAEQEGEMGNYLRIGDNAFVPKNSRRYPGAAFVRKEEEVEEHSGEENAPTKKVKKVITTSDRDYVGTASNLGKLFRIVPDGKGNNQLVYVRQPTADKEAAIKTSSSSSALPAPSPIIVKSAATQQPPTNKGGNVPIDAPDVIDYVHNTQTWKKMGSGAEIVRSEGNKIYIRDRHGTIDSVMYYPKEQQTSAAPTGKATTGNGNKTGTMADYF